MVVRVVVGAVAVVVVVVVEPALAVVAPELPRNAPVLALTLVPVVVVGRVGADSPVPSRTAALRGAAATLSDSAALPPPARRAAP